MPRLPATSITRQYLIVIVALYLVTACNLRFFTEAERVFPAHENVIFLFSLGILLCGLIVLLCLPFNTRYTLKPLLISLILIAASASYFADNFSTVIDVEMLRNILETDMAETADIITVGFLLHFLLFGILPALVVYKIRVTDRPARQELTGSLKLAAVVMAAISISIAISSAQYASFLREFKYVRYHSNPLHAIYSVTRLVSHSLSDLSGPAELQPVYPDARISAEDPHRELMILVVGETARADHFSLYGYERDTTPVLEAMQHLYKFDDVSSCGTSTAVSVPCIFSQLHRSDFSLDKANKQENMLDVLRRAGVSVLWRDNNSDSKGVAERVPHEDYKQHDTNPACDIECRDVGMLDGLQQYIDQQTGDILIILHQMGSHGPAYYKRVPDEFAIFQPACQSKVLSECSDQEVINAYDNTIYYTDWFLGEVVKLLKDNQGAFEAAMLYVSDHGESLGENGMYLHGYPYMFAPEAQTHVPMVMWLGDHNDIDELPLDRMTSKTSSHDALWSTLLAYYELELSDEDKESSLIEIDEY